MPPFNNEIKFSSIAAPCKSHEVCLMSCQSEGDMSICSRQLSNRSENGFHRFPDLPTETRHIIWKLILPEAGRIVYLQKKNVQQKACLRVRSDCVVGTQKGDKHFFKGTRLIDFSTIQHPDGYDIPGKDIRPKTFGFCSNTVIPIATVCQESRAIVAQRFTLAFGSESFPPTTWFEFSADTLYLDWGFSNHGLEEWKLSKHPEWRFSRHDLSADIRRVHRLALNDGFNINTEIVPYEHLAMRISNYTEWVHDILETFGNSKAEVRKLVRLEAIVDVDELIDQVQLVAARSEYHPEIQKHIDYANTTRFYTFRNIMPRDLVRLDFFRKLDTEEGLAEMPMYELPERITYATVTTKKRATRYYDAAEESDQLSESYFIDLTVMVDHMLSNNLRVPGNMRIQDIIDLVQGTLFLDIEHILSGVSFTYEVSKDCLERLHLQPRYGSVGGKTIFDLYIPPRTEVQLELKFSLLEFWL